jgi:hypothetical protein
MQTTEQHSKVFKLSDYVKDDLGAGTSGSSSLVGPEGGMVAVTDPLSPIFGTSLRIPPGALDREVRITITEGNHSCEFGLSPSIKLMPNGLNFKRATTLTVYLNNSNVESEDLDWDTPGFYRYDDSNEQWTHNSATNLEQMGNAVLCELHHL